MERYIRQTGLRSFGEEGQVKLASGRVLIVGLGGLGIPVAQYLNAMGVGTLGLVDNDRIALHNLQRQVLYSEEDVGQSKTEVAARKLKAQNGNTQLEIFATYLDQNNALEIIAPFDLIIDATDNFGTRYLINDACVILGKPFVYGAIQGFEGQVAVFNYQGGPTYRCVFPHLPGNHEIPNCNENGILGVLPGIIGTLQALEAVKVLTGTGQVLSGELLIYEGETQTTRKIKLVHRPENQQIQHLQGNYAIPVCDTIPTIDAPDFLKHSETAALQIIDVRNPEEFADFHLKQAKNLPLSGLRDRLAQIRWDEPAYFICQSGVRSRLAVQQIQEIHPEADIYHVAGGMHAIQPLTEIS